MKLLKDVASDLLSAEEADRLAGGFDTIGDIAVVKIRGLDAARKRLVGERLMRRVKNVRSVWNQVGPVEGEYRIRQVEHVAGEERSDTVYTEHGCRFHVDIREAYFSPRLSTERARVASLVREGEKVFNMFAGVGTFSVVMAKKVGGVTVYSSEINEAAYRLMQENARLNKVTGSVVPLLGDCREHAATIPKADRAVMSLPEGAFDFLECASGAMRPGGTVHYYERAGGPGPAEAAWRRVRERFDCFELAGAKSVLEVAPRTEEVVLDLVYRPRPS
ncbi:MAG: class I SAM-dependent methyltransferase family protein [Nitrososphaerota archaeon]|nr:class I SAM-dependent methyltransferase family protein [Nitrososphaerota archaeon]MDG6939831.1 class I SAM-dependent methyltransferase family protein [Nitrososphaerota archaeon]